MVNEVSYGSFDEVGWDGVDVDVVFGLFYSESVCYVVDGIFSSVVGCWGSGMVGVVGGYGGSENDGVFNVEFDEFFGDGGSIEISVKDIEVEELFYLGMGEV